MGGVGDFFESHVTRPFKRKVIEPIATLGAKTIGHESDAMQRERLQAEATASAAATEAKKQALFEASKREGLERLALKRKRGFGASMIVNPTLGSGSVLGG